MAGEKTESKLKLIHLVYALIIAAVGIGVAIGAMQNQQKNNTDDIKAKVEKEVFDQHRIEQRRSFDKLYGGIEKLDKKLDGISAKMK